MSLLDGFGPAVQAIRIETSVTPPITINDPLTPSVGGGPNIGSAAGKLLRPRITVLFKGGQTAPIVVAPFGNPPTLWPVAAGLLAVGLVGFAYWLRRRRGA